MLLNRPFSQMTSFYFQQLHPYHVPVSCETHQMTKQYEAATLFQMHHMVICLYQLVALSIKEVPSLNTKKHGFEKYTSYWHTCMSQWLLLFVCHGIT